VDDRDLREEFELLREDVRGSGRVPDFDAMLLRARDEIGSRPALQVAAGGGDNTRVRRRAVRVGGWVTLATAAAAAGILLIGSPAPAVDADAEFERLVAAYTADASSGAWRSPTATLLRSPGLDLGSVPSIGGSIIDVNPNDGPGEAEGRDS
jgi:hypothetical protein